MDFDFLPRCPAMAECLPPSQRLLANQMTRDFLAEVNKTPNKVKSVSPLARTMVNFTGSGTMQERKNLLIYNELVNWICRILKQENINPYDFFLMRDRLYEKFKPERLLSVAKLPLVPRIPLNLFTIWLTSPDDPVEPDEIMINFALNSSKNNPPEEGWQHFFVTNDRALLPKTLRKLAGSPITVIEFPELGGEEWTLKDEISMAIAGKKFGLASDMLRIEVIKRLGGGYLDIDLEVFQSLKTYFFLYDSLWGVEPGSEIIGNAFFASMPGHPIMDEYIRIIKRNFNPQEQPQYISDCNMNTVQLTGPVATSLAFFNAAGLEGHRDIAMPPQVFFPSCDGKRNYQVPRPGDSVPLESAAAHYWMGTWSNAAKYKSLG